MIYLRPAYFLIISFFILIFFVSCEKVNYDDALPKVEMVSIQMISDETTELEGRVTSQGAGSLKDIGFSFSKSPNPDLEDNQIVLSGTGETFKTQVDLMADSIYYFRSFAVNEFGYVLSSIKKFVVPHPEPRIAPCTQQENTIEQSGNTYPVKSVYTSNSHVYVGEYSVEVSNYQTGGPGLRIYFNKIPTNGIYVTNDNYSLFNDGKRKNEVYIRVSQGFEESLAEAGDSLYVSENPDGKLTISFCNLKYQIFNAKVSFKARFTFDK